MQAALPAAGNIPDQAQLEKSLAPGKRQIKRPRFRISFYQLSLSFQTTLNLPAPLHLGIGSSPILGKTPGFHLAYRVCIVAGVHYHSPFQEAAPKLSEEHRAPSRAFFVPVTWLSASAADHKPLFIYML
ncbi:hypothetical protein SB816_21715 [Achromobacter sp. SIMBA_011]|uniref:hypothetical protein n=1 Tax=Achromobacter TaxID=222 RepID=UPI0012E2E2FD|nr:hypothetical protein [Achromobacter dolens]